MKLSAYLKDAEKSIADAARELGYPHETVRKWATGERTPRQDAMRRIGEWSGGQVTANDFFASSAEPHQNGAAA